METKSDYMTKATAKIAILFYPPDYKQNDTTLQSTVRLFEACTEKVYVICQERLGMTMDKPLLFRLAWFAFVQLALSWSLLKLMRKIDTVVMAAGMSISILPAIVAKIMGKRLIALRPGTDSTTSIVKATYPKHYRYILPVVCLLEHIVYSLCNKIVIFRKRNNDKALKHYENRLVLSCSRFYVDEKAFHPINKDRKYDVGYIGRFDTIKGVLNFVRAVRMIDVKAVVIGDGELRQQVEREQPENMTLINWVPRAGLIGLLNEIRLLVIPSYAEAGPHLLFEAMSCGIPVLATRVGVMDDVIDGTNGFLLDNNEPGVISARIKEILNKEDLATISRNSRQTIERDYTFEEVVKKYKEVLSEQVGESSLQTRI